MKYQSVSFSGDWELAVLGLLDREEEPSEE